MAKKEISVVVKAKNALKAGLSRAGASLRKFGASAKRIAAGFAKGFLAAGAAVIAFGVKAVQAFAVQESAEKSAEAALRAHGDQVEVNMKKIKAFASAIQDETAVADEDTIARAGQLRLLGVHTDALEDAVKATIALEAAGMKSEAATRAVASARGGDYNMLQRYIPALKSVKTEAEKAAMLNDFVTKGYKVQQAQLDTVAGRWKELKGRIGDATEVIGGAIAGSGALSGMLAKLSEKVVDVGNKIAKWAAGGGVGRWINTLKLFANNALATFSQISAYSKFGMENAWESVKWFGAATKTVFKNVASVVNATWQNTTDSVGHWLAKMHAEVTGQEWNIQPPKMRDVMAGIKEIPEKSKEAEENLDKQLDKIAKKREAREKAIAEAAKKRAQEAAKAQADAAKKGDGGLSDADKAFGKMVEKADKMREERLAAVEAKRKNGIELTKKEIALLQKKLAINKEVAQKSIAQILEENSAREKAAEKKQEEIEKANELKGRVGRGIKLSKEDRAWLDAFEQIEAAKKGIGAGKGKIDKAQKQLQELKDQNRGLKNIEGEIKNMNANLTNLLQR